MNWKHILLGNKPTRSILMKSHEIQTRINEQVDGFLDKNPAIVRTIGRVIREVKMACGARW